MPSGAPGIPGGAFTSNLETREMIPRPDLLPSGAPDALEVFQLTEGPTPCSHVYMEAQVFTPDSRRFVLHRSATAHGGSKIDPEHQYLLCDCEDGALSRMTQETGATAPSVAPDGSALYYFVDETTVNGGKLTLKRVGLDGTGRETLHLIDAPLPEIGRQPSHIYPLSTISSDGTRLALSAFFGDGKTENAPYGLMVFDLAFGSVSAILEGPTWCNMHPQYCRSKNPRESHDLLVQENHGCEFDPTGRVVRLTGGPGADIHVIRDDGSEFRNLPWGRDGDEFCQGHQCWRGASTAAITSTSVRSTRFEELIESDAAPFSGHVGTASLGGRRNVLSRAVPRPSFYHFATDAAGKRFITDSESDGQPSHIYAAEFDASPSGALQDWRMLLDTRTRLADKHAHTHPFLSPDGTRGFFNSLESGTLHAYMITGLFD
jgi:WD40-like Beta Propeller Repeat